MSGISASTAAYYNSLSVSQGNDWLAGAMSAIRRSASPAGMLGALANSGNAGSLNSFLSSSKSFSSNFATIAQTNVSNNGKFYAQLASANQKQRADERVRKAIEALQESQQKVKPHNTLPSFLYIGEGTSLDTDNGILTTSDGTKIDITTGAEIIDPASIVQLGNGAYLNTQTNIMTLSDGTRIDTVTGLKVDTEA
jgi:hypothetical protein